MSKPAISFIFGIVSALALSHCFAASDRVSALPQHKTVKAVADQQVVIAGPEGTGELPVYASRKIDAAAPGVRRVLIIVHGTLRNADAYFASGQEAVRAAGNAGEGTLVVAPQFLTRQDVRAFRLSAGTLAWTAGGWKAGEPARSPAPISSFAALDGLLKHFADRRLYPALTQIIVAGHSAGAQVVQRYAVASRGQAIFDRSAIHVRYVVANPSSYLYFDNSRPVAADIFRPADTASCPSAIEWKYGLKNAPPYVAGQDVAGLEARYVSRDVVYLLGMADTNPRTHFIDRSCAAMAQGPYRLARGLAYFKYLQQRHGRDLKQSVIEVPGVGHDNRGMFTSACGLAVLFGETVPSVCPRMP